MPKFSATTFWNIIFPIMAFIMLLILNPDYLKDKANVRDGRVTQSSYLVSRVVDGDTIRVIIEDQEKVVRLVNINAPESVDPRKHVECLGKEAAQVMAQLVEDAIVSLELDLTQSSEDRYQRLLRFVFLEDGTDVGLQMIKQGYAYSTPYGGSPHKYLQEYELAQQEAIKFERGLWDPSACAADELTLLDAD